MFQHLGVVLVKFYYFTTDSLPPPPAQVATTPPHHVAAPTALACGLLPGRLACTMSVHDLGLDMDVAVVLHRDESSCCGPLPVAFTSCHMVAHPTLAWPGGVWPTRDWPVHHHRVRPVWLPWSMGCVCPRRHCRTPQAADTGGRRNQPVAGPARRAHAGGWCWHVGTTCGSGGATQRPRSNTGSKTEVGGGRGAAGQREKQGGKKKGENDI